MKSNKKNLKGYDIFDFDGTGMLEIQKVEYSRMMNPPSHRL